MPLINLTHLQIQVWDPNSVTAYKKCCPHPQLRLQKILKCKIFLLNRLIVLSRKCQTTVKHVLPSPNVGAWSYLFCTAQTETPNYSIYDNRKLLIFFMKLKVSADILHFLLSEWLKQLLKLFLLNFLSIKLSPNRLYVSVLISSRHWLMATGNFLSSVRVQALFSTASNDSLVLLRGTSAGWMLANTAIFNSQLPLLSRQFL